VRHGALDFHSIPLFGDILGDIFFGPISAVPVARANLLLRCRQNPAVNPSASAMSSLRRWRCTESIVRVIVGVPGEVAARFSDAPTRRKVGNEGVPQGMEVGK